MPKALIVASYFQAKQHAIENLEAEQEATEVELAELEEEQSGEADVFAEFDNITKGAASARLKEIKGDDDAEDERDVRSVG
ncbi:MAG: hypothetical protein AAFO89_10305 [Planctomycetota bacterium]